VESTIEVTIRYFGRIAELTGKREEHIKVSAATVRELIEKLSEMYGEKLFASIMKSREGGLREDIIILVNQKPIGGKLDTNLADGAVVSILPFVSGG